MKKRILSASLLTLLAAAQVQAQVPPGQPIPRNDPNGVYCREYTQPATVNGQRVKTYGTACQQPDGTWKIISNNAAQAAPDAPPPEYLGPPVYTSAPQYVAPPAAYYYPPPAYYGPAYPYPYYGGGISIGFGGGWHDGGGWRDHGGYYRH